MAWIESHQEVGRHPKTKKLARLLGVSLPAVVGHLHYLWWWALDFAQDGTLGKYDAADIADAMQWDGDADQLIDALLSAGYIDDTGSGLVIHDWAEYAGKLLERRDKDRARKRQYEETAGLPQDFRRTSDGNPKVSDGNPKVSDGNPKVSDGNPKVSDGNPKVSDGNPKVSDGNPKVSDVTVPNSTIPNNTVHNQIEKKPQSDASQTLQETRFAEFWASYPKKIGKASCLKVWKKLKPTAELHEHIMIALESQKRSDQWQREGGRFIPNPLTWLNQGRWDDEPVEVSHRSAGKPSTMDVLAGIVAAEEGGNSDEV